MMGDFNPMSGGTGLRDTYSFTYSTPKNGISLSLLVVPFLSGCLEPSYSVYPPASWRGVITILAPQAHCARIHHTFEGS